jgi:hypothetical protein
VVGEAPDREQGVVLLDQMKAHMISLQCCVVEGDQGYEGYYCPVLPSPEAVLSSVTSMSMMLSAVVMNYTQPSLSKLIVCPGTQVVMEVLHCVLNLVRWHVESLKLMCTKFFKVKYVEIDGRRVKMPEPKTVDEIARWDKRVQGDNSKDREKWRADNS